MNSIARPASPTRIAYRSHVPAGEIPGVIRTFAEVTTCLDLRQTEGALRLAWPEVSGFLVLTSPKGNGTLENDPPPDPELPVGTVAEMEDREAQEQFLDRVVGYREVRDLFREGWQLSDLVAFNVRERFRVIGHDPKKHKLIGRLLAKAKDHPREFLEREISSLFLSALAKPMTRRKHVHVLEQVAEFVGPKIEPRSRDELAKAIADYRGGVSPRSLPLALLRQHVEATGIAGLRAQSYLYPDETLLRFLELS